MTLSAKKLKELKAELIGTKVTATDPSLKKIEKLFPLSASYRKALVKIGGGIFFAAEVRVTPIDSIPSQRPDGTMDVSMLFGLGRGQHSILKQLDVFKHQLEVGAVPIADGEGGDLFVSDEYGKIFFWDHETDRVYLVAKTFDDFFSQLHVAEETE